MSRRARVLSAARARPGSSDWPVDASVVLSISVGARRDSSVRPRGAGVFHQRGLFEAVMANCRVLVLGTRNQKKRGELEELLAPHGLWLRTLADYPQAIDVEEDGQTFADNARKKASEQARRLGHWVLGEDSGLAVDALAGAPGVYSARYSGPQATDQSNNEKLLAELAAIPLKQRTAHYVCCAALADPSGAIRAQSEGKCRGRILFAAHGEGGFGYDPLFEVVEYHRTFGQLGGAVKSVLSHRSRAMRRILPPILALV